MPKKLPQLVSDHIEKCRACATAGVEVYNKPGRRFRTAHYVVLIVMAWTALFHAIFYRRGRRPWVRSRSSSSGTGIRYVKIDGEPRHWDLSECLRRYFGAEHPPERRNLEFLIGLRNKIEHRNLPEFDPGLYGECQASLLNLEHVLVSEFGQSYALAEQLAVSLQFSEVVPAAKRRAAQVLASKQAKSVADYVERFRGGLPSTVLNSMKYSFNVFLVPRVANRHSAADAAVEFIKVDEASPEELGCLEKLNVLIREKRIPIANLDLLRPREVVAALEDRVPFHVHMTGHTNAWRHFGVRPPTGDPHPERTRSEYCVYDAAHGDYLYTSAWVEKLVREFSSAQRFIEITKQSRTD